MQEWIVPAVLGALTLLALVLAVLLMLARARTDRELRTARAEAASLRAQLDDLERRVAAPTARRAPPDAPTGQPDFVITGLGEQRVPAAVVEPALFADLVLRESVVRAASLAHGLRIALAPETRNRIRFEVRREIRRSRKQRRTEHKVARREYAARQRARLTDDEDAA